MTVLGSSSIGFFPTWAAFSLMMTLAVCPVPAHGENALLAELLEKGVSLGDGTIVRLSAPLMTDGLDAHPQRAILERLAGRYPLDEFLRDSAVAPFVLKIESIADSAGVRIGHRVGLVFVVYGGLDKIMDEGLFEKTRLAGKTRPGLASSARQLSARELANRGIAPPASSSRERYSVVETPVLDRVQIRGVFQSVQVQGQSALTAAARLDPRFEQGSEPINQWQPITADELGNLQLGEPQPYRGYASYAKATALVGENGAPNGAVLIESETVFSEPQAWFAGSNILRAKLPLLAQDSVRTLRRELKR